ncbi:hypothetical protein QTP88_023963 [Uroleucon formosanum]
MRVRVAGRRATEVDDDVRRRSVFPVLALIGLYRPSVVIVVLLCCLLSNDKELADVVAYLIVKVDSTPNAHNNNEIVSVSSQGEDEFLFNDEVVEEPYSDIERFFKAPYTNGVSPTPGFRIARDKTTLERDLLRQAHIDLEQKKDAGSSNLTISYVNGVPTVVKAVPKNTNPRGSNHRPNTTQPIH